MKGCLKVFGVILLCVVALMIVCLVITPENDSSSPTTVSRPVQRGSVPEYNVAAKNKNGHTIFIVTQANEAWQLERIARDYVAKNVTPADQWMIQFFTDEAKALRVQREWGEPFSPDKWVYDESADHSGIGQWTPGGGVELSKW